MKTPIYKKSLFATIALLVIIFVGWTAYSGQKGVTQLYKHANAPFDDEKRVQSVIALPDDIVRVRSRYQDGFFWTETRKDKIERFKCSQCHDNKPVSISRAAEMAHGDIKLDHGGREKPLSCYTCHNKEERDYLETEAGVKVDIDHSYQLCAQCHFRQLKDWVGGAHGKRVSYWSGQRVVRSCVSCHNPHSPRFKKRWPVTYSPPFSK
jgi:hypothetical protein